MRIRPTAAILALLAASLSLSACYDHGRPGHDSDRHGHHDHDRPGDHDHHDH